MQKRKLYLALTTLVLLFAVGMTFYIKVEGWSFVEAFYFVGVTITTIGYGDIHPVTDLGRVFTVFFALMGVSFTLFILSIIAEHYFSREHSLINSMETQIDNVIEFQKKLNEKNKEFVNKTKTQLTDNEE